jgi:hypothetical protein
VEGEIETIGHYDRTNINYNPKNLWLELQHTIFSFSPKISNPIGKTCRGWTNESADLFITVNSTKGQKIPGWRIKSIQGWNSKY